MSGGGSAEDAEPLFVLEPLPELSNVMDSFLEINPLITIAAMGIMIYFLVKFEDPFTKYWTATTAGFVYDYYVSSSVFYSAMFACFFSLAFFLIWAAIRWDEIQVALGINKTRILALSSFVVSTWVLVILGIGIGIPTGSAIVVSLCTAAYLWWTYYSLEPAAN
jgi:hypothetical protein